MKYEYDFKDEKVELELANLNVSFNDEQRSCNVIETDKNILFFEDYTKNDVLRARCVDIPRKFRLIHQEKLTDVKITQDNDSTVIATKDNNEITIFGILL